MKTYWLSRDGAPTEGPYALDQLRSMWNSGHVTALDLAAEDGTEKWLRLADLMARTAPPAAAPPPLPLPTRKASAKRKTHPLTKVMAVVLTFGLVAFIRGLSSPDPDRTQRIDARVFAKTNFADAEFHSLGGVIPAGGKEYRAVRIKGENAFGGTVVNTYFAEITSSDGLDQFMTEKQFEAMLVRLPEPATVADMTSAIVAEAEAGRAPPVQAPAPLRPLPELAPVRAPLDLPRLPGSGGESKVD